MQTRKVALLIVLFLSSVAYAEDSETELLRQQITILQQQLQQLSQRLEAVESKPPEILNQSNLGLASAPVNDTDQHVEEDSSRVEVASNGNLLKFASGDGNYKFQIGGRIHADATVFDQDQSSFGNDSQIRRARIYVSGTLFDHWEFKNQIEFTEGGASGIRDSYLRYTGIENTKITIGNFKEAFSQEELQSSNHIPFIERAPINEFAPSRNLGIGIDHRGNYGDSETSSWVASAGVFGEGLNDNDIDSATNEEFDEGLGFTGRFGTALITTQDRLAHLGAAYSFRNAGDANNLSFSTGIEAEVANRDLITTGLITGVDNFTLVGLEAVGAIGPFSLQGEYIRTEVDRDIQSNLDFDGYYIYGSWFITGESRAAAYKKSTGVVRGITPINNFGEGGSGAWELVARFSHIDLTDQDIIGGEQDDLTLGVNWYPNTNLRFSFNYINILDVEGGENSGDELDAYLFRAQVTF